MSQLAEQSKLMDPSAPGLFEAISQVQQGHTVTVIVAPESADNGSENGQVRVTIYPTAPKTEKDKKAKPSKAGKSGDSEDALPFKGFSFVGDPREIDRLDGGLAAFFSEMHQSAQTLQELREETRRANETAEKAEKKLKDLADRRKKAATDATTGGPLFSGDEKKKKTKTK